MPVSSVNQFHPPGPLHIFLHDTNTPQYFSILPTGALVLFFSDSSFLGQKARQGGIFSYISVYVVYAGPLINLMMLGVREYKEELEQMMERVESQPTLFQKQTQVRALK